MNEPKLPPPLPPTPLSYQTPEQPPAGALRTDRENYNVASDLLIGFNGRKFDNLFQAVAILISMALGVGIGFLMTKDVVLGMLGGGFAGLLIGLFGSGIFLMIYRGIRHSRGKHD